MTDDDIFTDELGYCYTLDRAAYQPAPIVPWWRRRPVWLERWCAARAEARAYRRLVREGNRIEALRAIVKG